MVKYGILILLLLFFNNYAFSVFATINSKNATLYDTTGKEVGFVNFGRVINAKKTSLDGMVEVIIDGKHFFVKRTDLVLYNNVFSDINGKSKIISQFEHCIYFYFKNSIYKFNYLDRKVVKKREIKGIFDIVSSDKQNIFFIEGITTNESREIHNLLIYDFDNDRKVYIGSFDNAIVSVENVKFLKNSEYIAILFNRSGKRTIVVYKTVNGKMIGYSSDAIGIFEFNNHLFLYNNKYIWFFKEGNADFSKENLFINIPTSWLYRGEFNFKVDGGNFYIKTEKNVVRYDIIKKESYKTSFKSFDWNRDKTINFFEIGEKEFLLDIENNKTISIPVGYNFHAFVGTNYIFSGKFGKISSYFLFSRSGKELYRYKAIDKCDFIFENGFIIDLVFDKENCIIFVESPEKGKYYVAFVKE